MQSPPPGSSIRRRWLVAAVLAFLLALFPLSRAGTALVVSCPVPNPDIIVSLASHEWERLPVTSSLAARFPGARVVLTLPRPVTTINCHDCSNRVQRLSKMGVEPSRVSVLRVAAQGTFGEAVAVWEFARRWNARSVLVVTSSYHTRRSLAVFRSVFDGSHMTVGVTPATAASPAQPEAWWMTPYDRWYVRYEWAGLAYYLIRYGVTSFGPTMAC